MKVDSFQQLTRADKSARFPYDVLKRQMREWEVGKGEMQTGKIPEIKSMFISSH